MGTPIDWGGWANQAFSTGMDILKKQIGGTSTAQGKLYFPNTPNATPTNAATKFFSNISIPMLAAIGVAIVAIFLLIRKRR